MSFDAECSRRAACCDVPASTNDAAPPAPVASTGRRQKVPARPMNVQPVLYSNALTGSGALLPSVEYATAGPAFATSGDGGCDGGRERRRTNNDSQRMREEIMALARSPSCWRPLMVFVFSLVIGTTLALAAYGFRHSRLRRGRMPPSRQRHVLGCCGLTAKPPLAP
ncbi:hypothetical protein MTO96_050224, partial [Rhipicephalus appendiculatus]